MRKIVLAAMSTALALTVWAPTATATATASADQQAPKPIRITRVMYDPPGPDTGTNVALNRESVAMKNFGQQTLQLRGWTLRDASGNVFRFPRFRLLPGTTVKVHTGDGRATRHDLYWGREHYVWNNTGDRATVRNRDGRLIDRCRWGDGDGFKLC